MEISDPIVMTVAGGIVTTLTGTITALWLKVGKLEDRNDTIQSEYQAKAESNLKQVTELMVTATNQTNTYTNSITTLTSNQAQFQKEMMAAIGAIREMILGWKQG